MAENQTSTPGYDSLKCVQNRLPLLQFISVRRVDPHAQDNVLEIIMFSHAPQLHAAHLECYIPSSIMLQLTTLSMSLATLRECLNMLGRSPNVTECVFRGASDRLTSQPMCMPLNSDPSNTLTFMGYPSMLSLPLTTSWHLLYASSYAEPEDAICSGSELLFHCST
jgi:hypothetical protein